MVAFMDQNEKEWGDRHEKKAWALAHAQVTDSEEPVRMFVVAKELVAEHEDAVSARFPDRIILNPEILESPAVLERTRPVRKTVMKPTGRREIELVDEVLQTPNTFEAKEGCMSFVRRKPKIVNRAWRIKVRYQYPTKVMGLQKMKTADEWCEGLKAQIFQHEIEHMDGKNIYYEAQEKKDRGV